MAGPQTAQIDFTQPPPTQIDFTKPPPSTAGSEPDQFAKDRAVTEAWAHNHKILGPIARFLVAGGQNAATAITDTPSFLYHAITDPAKPEEFGLSPEQRVIARLGPEQAVKAGQSYARGEVTPKGAVSVLPEALGTGLGQVAGSSVYGKLGEVAGDVGPAAVEKAPAVVRASVKGANKALARAPGTIGGTLGAMVGGKLGGHLGAEIGAGAGALAGRELLPQVRLPGEGFGLPNRVAGGPPVAPSYAESLGPVTGGPATAPSFEEFGGTGKLSELNTPAVRDMSTVLPRLRKIARQIQKEEAGASAAPEEDLAAAGQKSVEAVIDNKVLGVLKKQGEGLTVSMQQLAKDPALSRFTPEQLQASAVRLRDAGKVWGHTARAAGEAAESIYGIASR